MLLVHRKYSINVNFLSYCLIFHNQNQCTRRTASENYENLGWRAKNPFKVVMKARRSESKILSFHNSSCMSLELVYFPMLTVTPNHLLDTLGAVCELKSNA